MAITQWQLQISRMVNLGKLPRPEPEAEGSLALWTVRRKVREASDTVKELDFDKLTFADLMERDDD